MITGVGEHAAPRRTVVDEGRYLQVAKIPLDSCGGHADNIVIWR
jgi:hypothetical protein